jgi:hypothetical protein
VIHIVRGGLFAVIVGSLAWLCIGSLVLLNRLRPEKPPLTACHAPDPELLAELADKHRMKRRPPVEPPGPGWREAELPELDPVEANRLHTECRAYLAAAP